MGIIGIDLAGVEKNKTGFCILEKMKAKTKVLYTDKEIVEETLKAKPELVTVDAPLSKPKKGIIREAEKELRKMKIRVFPTLLPSMKKLTIRGIKLRKRFEKLGLKVIETYPGAAQDILGIPRKKKKEGLRKGLKRLGIKGLKKKMTDHELDAITSALVGKIYLEKNAKFVGNKKEGQIIIPNI